MTRGWVAIQRNLHSGTGRRAAELRSLVARLKELGFRPRLFARREAFDRWMGDRTGDDRPDCLVAAGGDGTVADLLNRYPGHRLAILPLGTENVLAKHLRISRSGRSLAELIGAGVTRRFDLGLVGDRRFILMASCGFDADIAHRVDKRRRGHISKLTYGLPVLEALCRYPHHPLRVFVDDQPVPRTARLVVVSNVPAYALRLKIGRSASPEDGRFDVTLFGRGSTFQMLRYLYKVARGTHERLSDVEIVRATRVRIESDQPVPVQVDGDPGGMTPVELAVLPAAVDLLVPGEHD